MKNFNYDEQIESLTRNPEAIQAAWGSGYGLFRVIHPSVGCLTQIRRFYLVHGIETIMITMRVNSTPERLKNLILEVAKDEKMPHLPQNISITDLDAFKEYQERYDKLMETNEL